ncbi:hypothetical protein SFRURICE_013716 [Spodoptera frugiperda]|nr:hypothetical protein SFRURICE_013716 [Spodoptera frugiperda]
MPEVRMQNMLQQSELTILLHRIPQGSAARNPHYQYPPQHEPCPAPLQLRLVVEVTSRRPSLHCHGSIKRGTIGGSARSHCLMTWE